MGCWIQKMVLKEFNIFAVLHALLIILFLNIDTVFLPVLYTFRKTL